MPKDDKATAGGKPAEIDFHVLMPEELKKLKDLKATEFGINQIISAATQQAMALAKQVFIDTSAWWEDVTAIRNLPKPSSGCNYNIKEVGEEVGFVMQVAPTPVPPVKVAANDSDT